MLTKQKRTERQNQQAQEIEANQKALRESIAQTLRLVDQSEAILERHRSEREAGVAL